MTNRPSYGTNAVISFSIAACSLLVLTLTGVHLCQTLTKRPAATNISAWAIHTYDATLVVQAAVCVLELLILCGCLAAGMFFFKKWRAVGDHHEGHRSGFGFRG